MVNNMKSRYRLFQRNTGIYDRQLNDLALSRIDGEWRECGAARPKL